MMFRSNSEVELKSKEHSVPRYEQGDFIKVEFPDETTGVDYWSEAFESLCDHCDVPVTCVSDTHVHRRTTSPFNKLVILERLEVRLART